MTACSKTRQGIFRDLASAVRVARESKASGREMLAAILERLSIIIRLEAQGDHGAIDNWLIYALAEIMHDLPKEMPYFTDGTSGEDYVEVFLEKLTYWEKWLESRYP